MNNPLRGVIQKKYEMKNLKNFSELKQNQKVLEVGCGQGVGAQLIIQNFLPSEYHGIDLDEKMIQRAQKKGIKGTLFQAASVTDLPFDDGYFDAVIDFGVIHHVPNWQDALQEIKRVLKPGGEFLFEDLSSDTWKYGLGKPLKKVLEHPYEAMFSTQDFINKLKEQGLSVQYEEKSILGLKHFFGMANK